MNFQTIKHQVVPVFAITLGIVSATFGLKSFLIPNQFFDGGITGTSMFLSELFHLELWWLLAVVNFPFLVLGYRFIGKKLALRSAAAIAGLAVAIALLEFGDPITDDAILAAFFGGFFLGLGIGFAVRNGAVLDGTEIMALILSQKARISIGDVILAANIVIFSVIGAVFDIERALYSILTYLVASRTIDFFIHGIEGHSGVLIISDQSDAIRKKILEQLDRGVTVFKGESGLHGHPRNILFCVITRLEAGSLHNLVNRIDPKAFIVRHKIDDTVGGMTKRRGLLGRRTLPNSPQPPPMMAPPTAPVYPESRSDDDHT